MSTSSHAQPDPDGSFSSENGPQVVVRAGEYFVCSACGTMVRLPDEIVGQLVFAANPAAEKQPIPATPERDIPDGNEPEGVMSRQAGQVSAKATAVITEPKKASPSRPRRPKQPKRVSLAGEMIDGLRVPCGEELDRALAWVSFHLRVLDRQGNEIARLHKLLKERTTHKVPSPLPREEVSEVSGEQTKAPADLQQKPHAQEGLGVAPDLDNKHERGPP